MLNTSSFNLQDEGNGKKKISGYIPTDAQWVEPIQDFHILWQDCIN